MAPANPWQDVHFEEVARLRPVDLVAPAFVEVRAETPTGRTAFPQPAPYAALTGQLCGATAALTLASGSTELTASYDGGRIALQVVVDGRSSEHRSRRHGATRTTPTDVGLALTGRHLTAYTCEAGGWIARARLDLRAQVDTSDVAWLAHLTIAGQGDVRGLTAGAFGQLGLRDLRWVTDADGDVWRERGRWWLTASSAGPAFFGSGHTSVWSFDTDSLAIEHHADLYFTRADRPGVYGDHATHLCRDGERWLVATSTWGDFDADAEDRSVAVTLAESTADLLGGRHVLAARPLALPSDGHRSVGVWDPHLLRTTQEWLVGFVSATSYFRFHPVLAAGPSLDDLALRATDASRRATEGTTLVPTEAGTFVVASDGRDGRRGQRAGYPVFDLALHQVGRLEAAYPSNIPWPTLARLDGAWWMLGFDGTTVGGPLLPYGTHGDVVVHRVGR